MRYFALVFAVFSCLAFADTIEGKVVRIADGDSLTVLVDRRQVKVRLADIDAPKLKQAFGSRSRQSLSDLCFNKSTTGEPSPA